MMAQQETWAQLPERLNALALKLKLHFEQSREGEVGEAISKLRRDVQDAFEAAGNAVHDEAVRADVRDVGRLLADAVAAALNKVSEDLRDRTHGS
jgi:hypothetical protein